MTTRSGLSGNQLLIRFLCGGHPRARGVLGNNLGGKATVSLLPFPCEVLKLDQVVLTTAVIST